MFSPPEIHPVAFTVFGWPVHWYGVMWCCAIFAAFYAGKRLSGKRALSGAPPPDELLAAGIIGALFGGRLGYVLFYDFAFYAAEPLRILEIWRGGMSFHGGLLGVAAALFWTAKRGGRSFLRAADFAAVLAPVGLGLGRIGNFINGELPGRVAPPDLPWAVLSDGVLRHPSPLYQAFLEGIVLGALMWFLACGARRPPGFLAAVFLAGYGACRLFSEFFREPDPHLGLLIGGFSMGQLLSAPMLLVGLGMVLWEARTSAAKLCAVFLSAKVAPPPPPVLAAGAAKKPAAEIPAEKPEIPAEIPEEKPAETSADKPAAARWWKKIFSAPPAGSEKSEKTARAFSRRDKRRHKKKKRH